MPAHRRFPPERLAKLEGERRRRLQPPGPIVELVADLAPGRVLDIGVGVGYFAIPLVRRLPAVKVLGLDVEPKMLAELGERLAGLGDDAERIEPVLAAADARVPYPVADHSVDLVLAVNLVHELDDRAAFYAQLRRVLVPGGRLVICDWDPDGRDEFGPPVGHRIAPAVVEAELEAAGLVAEERRDLYADLYTLVACAPTG